MKSNIYIAPSILSADLIRLEEQVKLVAESGADYIHVDIMDGHFVPNITFGPNIVKALKKITDIPLDVHLMIENPEKYIPAFADAGANIITVHAEACIHLNGTIEQIKKYSIMAGVSINPATSLTAVEEVLGEIDLLLLMSVNPGFGGQKFIESSLDKITRARKMFDVVSSKALLEVDGGISEMNAERVVRAGANVLVAGSAIFNSDDIVKAMQRIKAEGEKGLVRFA
jgi:ribulose-phosphate 3-epimerase